jgi:uncharacterized protein YjbJ (UPF0337 family)
MNSDILSGRWEQLKGKTRAKWGELTLDDVDLIEGNAQRLVGLLQERYGLDREQAEQEVDDWLAGNDTPN